MIIMPSRPRLSTPDRSATSSPAAANNSGVEAAITDSMMASNISMGGPSQRADEADAVDDHGVAGQHIEQQDALEYLGEIERHFDGDFGVLAADEGQREKQARDQDAHRIKPAEEGDDDGGKTIARRYVGLQMSDRPRYLDDAGKACQRAGHRKGEERQLVGVEAGKARRFWRGADQPDFKSHDGTAKQHRSRHHDKQCDDRAGVQTATLDQGRHGGDRIEV